MSQTAEFDPKDFENVAASNGVYAKFYMRAIPDEAASAEAGSPKFADVEFIEIIAAGNGANVVRRPVRAQDKMRFRDAYRAFREGDMEQIIGTPLTEVTWISASMREELSYVKVRTLEQLAELNDQACGRTPGLYELKRKAAAWMASAKEAAPFTAMHAENDALKAQNEEMAARLAALEKSMAAMAADKPSKK